MNSTIVDLVSKILRMESSRTLRDYIVPGLYSYLLEEYPDGGKLRMFHMTRHQELYIVPHNHRFDFKCCVLEGRVTNYLYVRSVVASPKKKYAMFGYEPSDRTLCMQRPKKFPYYDIEKTDYTAGQTYEMAAEQFHSIWFQKGTKVLFHEGPQIRSGNEVLVPHASGVVCNTFMSHDWMMLETRQRATDEEDPDGAGLG